MARVTHVKKAQQRYATVPVIDPATGEPKRVPVMDKRTGKQKTDKRGKAVTMAVTQEDRTKPKPNYKCDSCLREIEVGTPYKHITPKSGPYGGTKKTRHESCPTWQVWEYSSSMPARLAQIAHDFEQAIEGVESPEDVTSALEDAATAIEEIAEEKRESATNIEEGFGHPTSASEQLEEIADSLGDWATEIEQVDVPELPETEERYFVTNGDGVVSDLFETDGYDTEAEAQAALDEHRQENGTNGDGDDDDDGFEVEGIEPDEPTDEQMEDWRAEVEDAVSIVNESPV
jgi:hypothetical protein